ncbi:SusC/RagA family TonB-linked outer membrane protein [Parabacteroides pacaensis]|uniref:SusC/RagA family TonB-linked outer membrane protein n=1 Tax=Parabacteroides pacaensis TaxID=2086575 RepID=UPI000D107365|nr:TonB-dependent receptor [Parabacteroides pacaensis]
MRNLVLRSFIFVFFSLMLIENIEAKEKADILTSSNERTAGLPVVLQKTVPIKGIVTDESAEPMIGVNVVVEGTTIGTMTDKEGNFTLNVPSLPVKLKFSYIGYKEQIISLTSQKDLRIVLKEDSELLDEVQVIGYGTQKKYTVTGAVSSVGTKDILRSPVPNVAQALTGKVPGMVTIQYSGQPGADDPAIFIRGIGTLDAARAKPLIMVDGVERSFFRIDPNEIENVTVLKDASATAVFGVRGANGVILVTTKRGEEGKAQISVSTSASLQKPIRLMEYANSYEYALAYNEQFVNDNKDAPFSEKTLEAFRTHSDPLLYPDIDWTDMIMKPVSFQSQHNLNISGGTDRVRYFTSIGILTQDGLFRTLDLGYKSNFTYNRYNYRANIDIDVTKSTLLSVNLGGRLEDTNEPNYRWNLFTALNRVTPFGGAGIYEGKWIRTAAQNIGGWDDGALTNADMLSYFYGMGYNQKIYNEINLDLSLTQKLDVITKGLSVVVKGSYNSGYMHKKIRSTGRPYYTAHRDPETNELFFRKFGDDAPLGYEESSDRSRNWYLEASLKYNRKFGNHNVSGLVLYNQWRDQYPDPGRFAYPSIPRGYVGLVGRATYDYANRYMVDFNIGYNGSENFAPGHRYGIFPAFSGGWILTEEAFMKDVTFLNYLKIRGSYGIVGNDLMSTSARFFYLPDAYNPSGTNYNFGTNVSDNRLGATELQMGNPLVSWEKAAKQNYGIDFSFFQEHFSGSFDYFIEKRHDILTTRNTAPNFIAITMPVVNIGKVDNKGFELVLKWNHKVGDFKYWINTNISYSKNKVVYKDEVPHKFPWLYETGQSVGQPFGYIFDGFVTEQDLTAGNLPDHQVTLKPGDAKYKDLNNDKVINENDICPIGNPIYPRLTGGITLGLEYKGFDFSMLWAGSGKVSRFISEGLRMPFNGSTWGLMKYMIDDHWTPEKAETAKIPRFSSDSNINNYKKNSTLWLKDASYIRLKNIQVGYTLNGSWMKKIHLKNMRIYASGENLLTFDHLKIADPESTDDRRFEYPLQMIFNVGLNLNF